MATVTASTPALGSVRLNHLAALDVKGADAEKFLQGQTSAQVSLANGHFAPLTCFCTPKGRMLANAQLMRLGEEHFRLLLSVTLLESLANHLKKFAAFYKAELVSLPDLIVIGASDDAQALANQLNLELPDQVGTHTHNDHASTLLYPGETSRWLLCFDKDHNVDVASVQDDPASRNAWQLEDIRSGLAWLTDAQQDHFLPQMLNWEALGGISFKKGCYTGQEVVARAHFRGQVKKRLMRVSLASGTLPEVGASVVNSDDKAVGEVVVSATTPQGGVELLAVMNTKVAEEQTPLFLAGAPATLLPLPYAIERVDPEQLAVTLNG
ncbi:MULTISPECIES: folate-binding protein YgfZ [unclassified Halomonas]|uniref:CAF17-like 4Fe-4S cluster assembly/insertion protein YgfZ n=1 Tax=unclassified Halomonas TaxID=2609666 RepID=UPI0007D9336D|nr:MULTISPECIES: folate-binding protein YgfZ [unclassified Halomonas]MBT2787955.1 folate-binding protein YgfZ [Halomonas sp. ISL-106]MBT2795704.1 folate-binding protein YgfZ [Halomonas sp. ISL-104]OAL61002.1 aminomethyltransferase [Halomonas sp. ALS9]